MNCNQLHTNKGSNKGSRSKAVTLRLCTLFARNIMANSKQVRDTSRNRLKDLQIRRAKPDDFPLIDGGGLRLVLKGSGSKAWVYRYRFNGKDREAGLGIYPVIGVEQARRMRDRMEVQRAEGFDPLQVRQQERLQQVEVQQLAKAEAVKQALTLAVACRQYHETKIVPTAKNRKHAAQWVSTLENHVLPKLGTKSVADITKGELLEVVQAVVNATPETGRRVIQRLMVVFDELVFKEVLPTNPVAAVQRQVKAPSRAKIVKHFNSLPWAQVRSFYRDLEASDAIAAKCIQWVILTACRTGEALSVVPDELDLQRGLWVVPAEKMKAKRPHTVYLSTQAIELATRMLALGTPFLFPSRSGMQSSLSNAAMLKTLERLGYRDQTTIHGLRSTFSTWANEHNFRPDVVEVSLAHQEGDRVRKAYNHAVYVEQRLTLMQQWGDFVTTDKVDGEQAEGVHKLVKKA